MIISGCIKEKTYTSSWCTCKKAIPLLLTNFSSFARCRYCTCGHVCSFAGAFVRAIIRTKHESCDSNNVDCKFTSSKTVHDFSTFCFKTDIVLRFKKNLRFLHLPKYATAFTKDLSTSTLLQKKQKFTFLNP